MVLMLMSIWMFSSDAVPNDAYAKVMAKDDQEVTVQPLTLPERQLLKHSVVQESGSGSRRLGRAARDKIGRISDPRRLARRERERSR
jgi:hypothetical protein